MQISDREFRLLRDLIYRHFGINLTEQKRALMVGRLQKLVRDSGFRSFDEYYNKVLRNPSNNDLSELVNRISTNYTFFNREPEHFEFFHKHILPELETKGHRFNQRVANIWCAASSTGEEPYMLAMLMMDHFGLDYNNWDAGVLATDISEKALGTARLGIYLKEQTATLPGNLRNKFFRSIDEQRCQVRPDLQAEVTFRRFNLINKSFPFRRLFHVIFCRNVMIYFDQETKDALVDRMYNQLAPGGYLILGHSEAILRHRNRFQSMIPAVYRKV